MFWHEEMNEQARLAGLLMEDLPRWETKEYELRGQWKHAAVVVHDPHNEKDEIVVLLGGNIERSSYPKAANTVSLRKSDGSLYDQCPRGPSMNEEREGLAAVVCNGYVYAIGGQNRDSMERIQVSDLLSSADRNKTEKETPWKTLTCRLSATHVWSSSAAVVQNRYIVIGGGNNGNVDIVDISEASQPFIFQAPSLTVPRYQIGMAAIGSRVYVIGGYSTGEALKQLRSVEYLDMLPDSGNDGMSLKNQPLHLLCHGKWTRIWFFPFLVWDIPLSALEHVWLWPEVEVKILLFLKMKCLSWRFWTRNAIKSGDFLN